MKRNRHLVHYAYCHLRLSFVLGFVLLLSGKPIQGADLAIQIPGNLRQDGSYYRLDYSPPHGNPPSNTTIASHDIGDVIEFSQGLPGTRYEFWLYYSNATRLNWRLTWTASITTAPDPPSNLSVQVIDGNVANITWSPPARGNYSGFQLKLLSSSDDPGVSKLFIVEKSDFQYTLQNLITDALYHVQLFTVYDEKKSLAFIARNFTSTTLPHVELNALLTQTPYIKKTNETNMPGKFLVWFRNETTLLVLLQPSVPAGVFTHYKASIHPADAERNVVYMEKDEDSTGLTQAIFKGLVPGRAYNISIQTVNGDSVSAPTTAQYRTTPLRPLKVTFDNITSNSFRVMWEPPKGTSEFDKYQIEVGIDNPTLVSQSRERPTALEIRDNLEPGHTYQVVVKTVSGKVSSWPTTGQVTLSGSPAVEGPGCCSSVSESTVSSSIEPNQPGKIIVWFRNETILRVLWQPPFPAGIFTHYKTSIHPADAVENVVFVEKDGDSPGPAQSAFKGLVPGRAYNISVQTVNGDTVSAPNTAQYRTVPLRPLNVTFDSITSNSFRVMWEPPKGTSEFDKYQIEVGLDNPTLVSQSREGPTVLEIRDTLEPSRTYQVMVKTVSGKVSSWPTTGQVTLSESMVS